VSPCICASCGIATNNAANCACCEVVAAEELDLFLGFGEGGSHGVGRLWVDQAGGVYCSCSESLGAWELFFRVQGMLGWRRGVGGVEEYKINSLQTRDRVV
jgi:hypothetical protein